MTALAKKNRGITGGKIDGLKASIKAELDQLLNADARVEQCIQQMRKFEDPSKLEDLLSLIVYGTSCVFHLREVEPQNEKLARTVVESVENALNLTGILPDDRNGGVLWEDLRAAESLIHRTWGEHWRSTWLLATSKSQREGSLGPDYELRFHHGMALRCLRMGDGGLALRHVERAIAINQVPEKKLSLSMLKMHIHRMRGEVDECIKACDHMEKTIDPSSISRPAVIWERAIAQIQGGASIVTLDEMIKPSAETNLPRNFIEAFFWSRAHPDQKFAKNFPRLRSRSRSEGTRAQDAGAFYRAALAFERFDDKAIPASSKLEQLSRVLARKDQLLGIDMELLILAAAARLLASTNESLREIVTKQYEWTCYRLSDGKSKDVLGAMKD